MAHLSRFKRIFAAAVFASCFASLASAAETRGGWGDWWLPPNHSAHGGAIDVLFTWIFWITTIVFIGVEATLVAFLIKYRHRPGRKAIFTHGNTRLEMIWTLAPAVILATLALVSKKIWDNYRYSPTSNDPSRATVLVIGEQFKWNFIYPGPDGKLGRYLLYPKPTDERWQNPDGSGKPFSFQGTTGPSELPVDKAVTAIKSYILQVNPLGKDFDDPDGLDDNWVPQAGTRDLVLPAHRPIEVQLSSKDVIHDFFLPNFRVKLDAVPGMRGHIYFTSEISSKEREDASRRTYSADELLAAAKDPANADLTLVINKSTPQSEFYKPRRGPGYQRYVDKDKQTIARDAAVVTSDLAQQLKDAGITQVTAYKPATWELVCEELCGANHYSMRGVVRFADSNDYDAMKLDKPYHPGSAGLAVNAVSAAPLASATR